MADILTIIAAVEWIALGLLVLWKLKKWNKVFQDEVIREGRKYTSEKSLNFNPLSGGRIVNIWVPLFYFAVMALLFSMGDYV